MTICNRLRCSTPNVRVPVYYGTNEKRQIKKTSDNTNNFYTEYQYDEGVQNVSGKEKRKT